MTFSASDGRVNVHGSRIYQGTFLKYLVQYFIISGDSTIWAHLHIQLLVFFFPKKNSRLTSRRFKRDIIEKISQIIKKWTHMVLAMDTHDCKQNHIDNWQDIPWCHWLCVLLWLVEGMSKWKRNINTDTLLKIVAGKTRAGCLSYGRICYKPDNFL